ncbi:MAG: hypothetical protein BGO76_07835 [Caedibacter sp. 38-128]|nr:hypothetical protein [Holosporales bacterium]OJX04910.1 MAG: hypothetical protein BGO76_07835 [Caedibacter sp. 38-128]
MKKFIKLLLAISTPLLVHPLYASNEMQEDSERSSPKRKIETPKHHNEPLSKKPRLAPIQELPLELMGSLPIEIVTHITNYLYLDRDIPSLANLASCSKGLHLFLSEEYNLEAIKAFIKLDPSLEERQAFSLWEKIYSKSRGVLEALYRDKYYAEELEGEEVDEGNIDYSVAKNISNLELFFYAQGLIRGKPERISAVLQLPEGIDPEADIKRRSLDIFGYLERVDPKELLARLSSRMASAITSDIIVSKLGEKGFHWRERAPELYASDQEKDIEEIGRELNLPLPYWDSFSDISFSDQQDAADWYESFYATSQSTGVEKEQAFGHYFYHTPGGEYISRLAENNPAIGNLFHDNRSRLTFQQQKEFLEDLESYAINKIKELVEKNQQS